VPETPDVDVQVDPVQVFIPRDFVERIPDWGRDAMESAERMARDNEHVREMMREIRMRIREEARRQQWRQMIAERKARAREFDLIDSP
jgi:vacuolar-type H+-ATPase catalytic subunit A/Vma1